MKYVGRPLDGHVSRSLEGKTIERITKDGNMMTIHVVGGEEFQICWATPNGEAVEGEPCLVKVDAVVVIPQARSFVGAGQV